MVRDDRPPVRTTLLELVQSLTHEDLAPDEVVWVVHESIHRGRVALIGSFRDGLGVAPHHHAPLRTPTRRQKHRSQEIEEKPIAWDADRS